VTQLGPPDPDLPPRESGWSSPQVDAMVRLLGERGSVPAERFQNYYDDILHRRLIGSGRVTFLGGSESTPTAPPSRDIRGFGRDHPRRRATPRRRRHLPRTDDWEPTTETSADLMPRQLDCDYSLSYCRALERLTSPDPPSSGVAALCWCGAGRRRVPTDRQLSTLPTQSS